MQSIRDWFDENPDSLDILMRNASYVYFKETSKQPRGDPTASALARAFT